MNKENYWFADRYNDALGEAWIPTLQLGSTGVVPLQIHFTAKEDCLDWMHQELTNAEVRDE